MEKWKDIAGLEGIYQISSLGRVKSLERKINSRYGPYKTVPERILSLNKDKNTHYVTVTLSLGNKRLNRSIHRLVAQAFIDNPENKCCVNHIDGNPSNNELSNLEWCTMSENSKHAYFKKFKRKKTSWNKEEVIELLIKYGRDVYKRGHLHSEWIEQNL